jgi:hypothetical protein
MQPGGPSSGQPGSSFHGGGGPEPPGDVSSTAARGRPPESENHLETARPGFGADFRIRLGIGVRFLTYSLEGANRAMRKKTMAATTIPSVVPREAAVRAELVA